MLIILRIIGWGLIAALGLLLVTRYRTTRNPGYAVLGLPLVLWPFIWMPLNWLLANQLDRHIGGKSMLWPLSILDSRTPGEIVSIVGTVRGVLELSLLLAGFLILGKSHGQPTEAPFNSPLQPTAPSLRAGRGG